jgi:mannose/cellobiose epimerase-like protein (N-acyl-D-glucosamine 2-epimerase family)
MRAHRAVTPAPLRESSARAILFRMKELPDFRTPEFLRAHARSILAFYDGRCLDPAGGFFHFYKDDGTVYDTRTRHLVSSARFVVTHAWAAQRFADDERAATWRAHAAHGLRFIDEAHRDDQGRLAWLLSFDNGRREVLDGTQRCYGYAFVLLAFATALSAGIPEAAAGVAATFEVLERRFWEPAHGLYANEADERWQLAPYRGQNANMHMVEALLAAHAATGEALYLARATTVAESITHRLAEAHGGLVWEHYTSDWAPDTEFHRGERGDVLRPWGIQPGHLAEWAKLLLALERAMPRLDSDNWMQHRARQLFAAAVEHGWDRTHGGLIYTFGPDFAVDDHDKYFWVQAEAIGAAAALAERTVEGGYWDWYDRLWAYAWDHFVDHEHGAWFRQLDVTNHRIDDLKSPAPKTDYHTLGACFEALDALSR